MAATSRRQRVMSRSRKLGHCICDPRKSCPCDLFRTRNICQCAGERLTDPAAPAGQVQLTKLVKHAGCASKIPPVDLARVLSRLPAVTDPRLLVGAATADDAGVFQVSPDLCLVQTVDVFTPSVDDPYTFGRIAACNSLSDVYAMGGRPLTALSIIGYPIADLADEWMCQMLKGGMDVLAEAGVVLAGGHSINDEEIKFGFAVTGLINPDAIITNAGAKPGDALLLTKPIGTGIVAFAAQIGRASPLALAAAAASMAALNRAASEVMIHAGAHACTDVTGFGLLGHLYQMARESGVTAEISWDRIPLLPEALDHARAGMVSGAAERNREFASPLVTVADGVPDYALDLLYDAQTSGGLLFAVPAEAADATLAELKTVGCHTAAIIGRITQPSDGRITVTGRPDSAAQPCCPPEDRETFSAPQPCCPEVAVDAEDTAACCSDAQGATAGPPSAQQAFQQFMSAAFAPGALDVVQKELTTIALSVAVQCDACLTAHLSKALSMGITLQEIQEAAWLGVVFGGCEAMMFWREHERSLGTSEGTRASNTVKA